MDECQGAPALTFKTILDNTPSYYRIGITATPERKDKMHFFMFDTFGSVICKIEDHEIKDRVTDFSVEVINTEVTHIIKQKKKYNFQKLKKGLDMNYTECVDFLINSPERNALIVSSAIKDIQLGHKVAIVTYRTEHAKLLFDELSKYYKGYLIIGENSHKFDFEAVKNDMEFNFIVANKAIFGEGTNIPQLSCLHHTLPTSNMPKLKQVVGRIRRVFEGKLLPKVVDYVDNNVQALSINDDGSTDLVPIMKYSYLNRNKFYKKMRKEYLNI
jgi:superfamily II DNA or RNA helicase